MYQLKALKMLNPTSNMDPKVDSPFPGSNTILNKYDSLSKSKSSHFFKQPEKPFHKNSQSAQFYNVNNIGKGVPNNTNISKSNMMMMDNPNGDSLANLKNKLGSNTDNKKSVSLTPDKHDLLKYIKGSNNSNPRSSLNPLDPFGQGTKNLSMNPKAIEYGPSKNLFGGPPKLLSNSVFLENLNSNYSPAINIGNNRGWDNNDLKQINYNKKTYNSYKSEPPEAYLGYKADTPIVNEVSYTPHSEDLINNNRDDNRYSIKKTHTDLKLPKIGERISQSTSNLHQSLFDQASSTSSYQQLRVNSRDNRLNNNKNFVHNELLNKPSNYGMLFGNTSSNHGYGFNISNSRVTSFRPSVDALHSNTNTHPHNQTNPTINGRISSPITKINEDLKEKEGEKIGYSPSIKAISQKGHNPGEVNRINTDTDYSKLIANFSFKSKPGSLPNKPIKTNQDSYIIHPNFTNQKTKFLFGVCDGHGINGHHVSENIEYHYKLKGASDDIVSVKQALHTAFMQTNKELLDSTIDCNFSGTTTVTTLILGKYLFCSNVGDSRAILAKYRNEEWISIPLSNDHKPDEKTEMQRIINSGGRVEPFKDINGNPLGPYRVWLKNENVPGLAMARSLGDCVASQAGVIHEPETLEYELTEEDKFIVIASDGVWEFLSNQQVVNHVVPYYNKNQLEQACDKIVRESTQCWKQEDEVVDDITCIIISLKVPPKQG